MSRRHINLIGYRGVGKSTLGGILKGRLLGFLFYDTDEYIVKKYKKSILDIFREFGEEGFRDIESEVLESLCKLEQPIILSTGGGMVIREQNRVLLKEHGYNILLEASESDIYKRLCNDIYKEAGARPSLTDKSLEEEIVYNLKERDRYYKELKDIIIDTSFYDAYECVELIIDFIKSKKMI